MIISRKNNILLLLIFLGSPLNAGVKHIELHSRETIVNTTKSGDSIPYEIIKGIMHMVIDPQKYINKQIVDLQYASTNQNGLIEYNTEFELHYPSDDDQSNKRLLYFVNNRGNKFGNWHFNSNYDGNWLYEMGYSYLWCGWNADVPDSDYRFNIDAPVAHKDGNSITGNIYSEMISYSNDIVYDMPIVWGGSTLSPPVSLDNSSAKLSKQKYREDEPILIPNNKWQFGRLENGIVVPDSFRVYLKEGFEPGWLYDLVYKGKDPKIVGIGLAAIRDVVSFFRYEESDSKGNPNPISGKIQYSFAWGHSQSARLLNHFVYQNFNLNKDSKIVFDGVMMNCPGAGKGLFNSRFAQLTRHGSHLEDRLFPIDIFPFATVEQIDFEGKQLCDAFSPARKSKSLPKMMFINSSTDYWTRAASLLHTDVFGENDIEIDENARIYSVAGIAHTDERIGIIGRALLTALNKWVSDNIDPPGSKIPLISNGTLININKFHEVFPNIPSIRKPSSIYQPYKLDMGARWDKEGVADIQPPEINGKYICLVPQVDDDGNEIAGIKLPEINVPLSTYTGWSMRNPEFSNTMRRNAGNIIPLPHTSEDRIQANDPRNSIIERYLNKNEYLSKVEKSLNKLINQGFLLSPDYKTLLTEATFHDYWESAVSPNKILSLNANPSVLCAGGETILTVKISDGGINTSFIRASLREANNLHHMFNDNGIDGDRIMDDGIWTCTFKLPTDITKGTYNLDLRCLDDSLNHIYMNGTNYNDGNKYGTIQIHVDTW